MTEDIGTEQELETRYQNATKKITELGTKAAELERYKAATEQDLSTLQEKDPEAWQRVMAALGRGPRPVEAPKPTNDAPDKPPAWFEKWRSEEEQKRSKAEQDRRFKQWLSDIESREKDMKKRFPELDSKGYFGAGGLIDREMKARKVDDWELVARYVIKEPDVWDQPKAPAGTERPASQDTPPLRGKTPPTREAQPQQGYHESTAEGGSNRAAFLADPRVKGRA